MRHRTQSRAFAHAATFFKTFTATSFMNASSSRSVKEVRRSRSHATRASTVSPPCSSPIRYAETQNCCSAARKRCGRQVTPLLEDDKKMWRGFISPPVSLSRTRDLSGGSQTFTSPIKDLIRSFDPNTISHRPSTRKEVLKN